MSGHGAGFDSAAKRNLDPDADTGPEVETVDLAEVVRKLSDDLASAFKGMETDVATEMSLGAAMEALDDLRIDAPRHATRIPESDYHE